MARPRKVERHEQIQLRLPESLIAEVTLQLYSKVQERVPLGALSAFFERAARRELELMKGAQRDIQSESKVA